MYIMYTVHVHDMYSTCKLNNLHGVVNAHVHVHTCKCQEEDIQQCCITSMVYRIVSSEFVAHDMVYMYSTFMLHMRVSINVGLHGNTCV